MAESEMVVLDPTGRRHDSALSLAPRRANLEGTTVGLLETSSWRNFGVFLQRYKELLQQNLGVGEVIYFDWKAAEDNLNNKSHAQTIRELAGKCKVVIIGLGMSGSSTARVILDGIEFEKRGIPVAAHVTEGFLSLADSLRKGGGMPNLNLIVVPHPFDPLSDEEVIAVAGEVFGRAVAAVTTGAAMDT